MSTLDAAFGQLPEPILNKLDSMIRRVRRLLFLRGFFATLAVALACLLTIMVIDASVTLFSSTSRWALSLVGLAITIAAAWKFLVRPLSRKFTLTHMARILEIRHPELQERISTAVELLSSDDPDSIKGSEELIAAVVDSAVDDVQSVDPNTEFNPSRTKKVRNVSIAFGVILLLSLVIWPKQSWTLLTRALAPFLDIGNAYADSLIVDPGDVRIAQGESVSIEVSVNHKRLRRAEIRRLMPDGTESVERMTLIGEDADGTKRFSTTFPNVELGFDYRIRAGSALTRYYDVEAVAPPMVDQLTVAYDYPDYTGLESTSNITETGEIRAVSHTRVTVEAKVNKPVQTSNLLINGETDLGVPEVEGNLLRWYFELKPNMKGSWNLDLSDLDGFENSGTTYPIEALPDKAPTVQLTQPLLREMKLRPTERLQLHAQVIEDFGVKDVTLLVTPQGATQPIEISQPAVTPAKGPNNYHAAALLDLAALSLRPEQKRISVQMQVRDTRPTDYSGPGIGLSEMIFIEIDRSAKSLADQAIEAQKKEVKEALKNAKTELEKARDDLRRTEDVLKRDEEVSREARERLEDFSEHSEKARDELDKVAAALDESLLEEQAEKAAEISNETIAEAREKADLVPVLDEKEERVEEAREAREKIEEAIKQVDEIAKEMEKAEEDYEMISELNELSNKQQELAMNAEEMAEKAQEKADQAQESQQDQPSPPEMSDEEKRQLADFQRKQDQLQQELGEMLKENAAALSEVLEEQKSDAREMAEQAAELAEKQNELREMTQEALEADSNQEEALREELLAFLEKEQSQLAEDAAEQAAAAQEAADQAEQSNENNNEDSGTPESPSSESSNTDPANAEASTPESPNSDPSSEDSAAENPESSSESSDSSESSNEPEGSETSESSTEPEGSESSESTESSQPESATAENSPSESSSSETSEDQSPASPEQALADQLAEAAEQAADAAESLGEENLEAASEAASDASESLAEAASQSESGEMSESGDSGSESEGSEESASDEGGEESSSQEMAENGSPSESGTPESSESGSEEAGSEPGSPEDGGEGSPSEMAEGSAEGTSPGELAERQEALAEQIEAVKNGDLQEALSQIEAQLSEEASELQAAAEALEQNMDNLSQNSAESGANRAEEALSRGSEKASDAASQLSQAQQQQSQAQAQSQVQPGEMAPAAQQAMNRSLAEQQKTENYLEQAAEALDATSEAIGQTQEGLEPSDMDERIADSSGLAKGFEEMSESAQSQSAQEAAQQAQQAAEAMQQLAQAAMQKLGMPGQPSQQNTPPGPPMPPQEMTGDPTSESLNESGMKAADANGSGIPPELEQLGISVEDWAKFRGALVGGSATAIETDLPAEYRELVGRYFQVIAKEAGKKK